MQFGALNLGHVGCKPQAGKQEHSTLAARGLGIIKISTICRRKSISTFKAQPVKGKRAGYKEGEAPEEILSRTARRASPYHRPRVLPLGQLVEDPQQVNAGEQIPPAELVVVSGFLQWGKKSVTATEKPLGGKSVSLLSALLGLPMEGEQRSCWRRAAQNPTDSGENHSANSILIGI